MCRKIGLLAVTGAMLGMAGCDTPSQRVAATRSTSNPFTPAQRLSSDRGSNASTPANGKQILPDKTDAGDAHNSPSGTNKPISPFPSVDTPVTIPDSQTDTRSTTTQTNTGMPTSTESPAFTAALEDGIAWSQVPASDQSPWTIYYTPGADLTHLDKGARVEATLPLQDKTGGTLSLIRMAATGHWLVYEYSDWPDRTSHPLYTSISAVDVTSGKVVPIWQGPIGQTSHLTYSVASDAVLYAVETTGSTGENVNHCSLLNLDTQTSTSVHLPNWSALGWNGTQFTAESSNQELGINSNTGMVSILSMEDDAAYKGVLNRLRSTVHIPIVLPLSPPSPQAGQYYYTQYEALSNAYSVALFSSAQPMMPNALTSYGDTTFLGSIRAANGEGALTAESQIPSLLATAVTVDSSKPIDLIDGKQGTLLHAVGAGGGDAGYYVQWYNLGWLYTWGDFQTQDDVDSLLPTINGIVKRFEHDTPVAGIAAGEVDFPVQLGSTGEAVWNANGAYYTASAPNNAVIDFIQSLRLVAVTPH